MTGVLATFTSSPPDAPALTGEFDATYGQLAQIETALIAQAQCLGITPAHRLAVLTEDRGETLPLLVSLMGCASVLPLNPALPMPELADQMRAAQVDALVGFMSSVEAPLLAQCAAVPLVTLKCTDKALTLSGAALPAATERNRPRGLVLLTSGSTGTPKRVPLSPEACLHSARTIAESLALSKKDIALHALPMFHVGALVDLFLAPLSAGGAVHVAQGKDPEALQQAVRDGATWMQLVPTMLARCLADIPTQDAARMGQRLRFIRSVSADLAPERHAAAEAHFADTPLIQMYGMTETAGQITANPLPPAARKPGSVGQPRGAEIRILDPSGAPVPQGSTGEVCVRGPAVMAGYERADPAEHFFGDWLRTGDLGYLDAEGYLFLTGRLKEIINRGGEKISPVEIERAALSLAGVVEAAAFAEPHPTLGEQVGLAIVLLPECNADEAALLDELATKLAAFQCPRRLRILPALPRLGSGKIDKRALMAADTPAGATRARTGIDARIAQAWQEALNAPEPPGDDEDFFDAGGDSLIATAFITKVQNLIGAPVPPNALFDAPRFAAFVAAIAKASTAARPSQEPAHIAYLRAQTAGWSGRDIGADIPILARNTIVEATPLFLCSQGEGADFIQTLGGARPLYRMRSLHRFPGRTDTHNDDIAHRYTAVMEALQPVGPFYLVGFCEGARIMDLVARKLIARGRDVACLVSVDHWFETPTAYPVLHVWSESRRHSATRQFARPDLAFPVLHPAGAEGLRVRGKHGEALSKETWEPVLARLSQIMDGQKLAAPVAHPAHMPPDERPNACQADIALTAARRAPGGSTLAVSVMLRNCSDVIWEPSETSGLSVTLGWRNLDLSKRLTRSAPLLWSDPVAPGETILLSGEINVPKATRPFLLEALFEDQGFASYAARNGWRGWRWVLVQR
ncbi:AMP-binding protein [Primorskyibacter sp. S187A]|uniref:AMP-binding protein n=1 Tax=Primorskyibacter sp. S187A TaxID=3415130 RepID=UPI003C7E7141